jgi:Cysteine-rich secretory protein family
VISENVRLVFSSISRISHFAQMASDRINNVGCAMSRYSDKWNPSMKTSFFVCNYSFSTVYNEPVYQSGGAAERCRTGNNPQWSGLCSADEAVTPYASGKYGNW